MGKSTSSNLGTSNNTKHIKISAPKFSVHFRVPENMMGRYGFDYPRDKDIYPIEMVGYQSHQPILKSDMNKFKDVYLADAILSEKLVKKGYLPAWLLFFPYTDTATYTHGSTMHSAGVKLDIELHLDIGESSLADDGMQISFVPSDSKALIVKPTSIPLSKFLATNKITQDIDKVKGTKRYQYNLEGAVLIKGIKNQVLTKHQYITVYATKNGNKHEVGVLMVHKNNTTYKAELVFVDVTSSQGSKVAAASDVEYQLKMFGLNQALIRAEKVAHTKLDLFQLAQKDSKVMNFIGSYRRQPDIISYVEKELIAIYERHGNLKPLDKQGKSIRLDDPNNKRTFVFITDLVSTAYNGFASASMSGSNIKFGNCIILFKHANTKNDTLMHELGHSFGLLHIFDSNAEYQFHQGWSNKIMDYLNQNPNKREARKLFTRYEWYKMRQDESIKSYTYGGQS